MSSGSRVDLPDHLLPMLTGTPHLHVFGPDRPWVSPPGWLADLRRELQDIALRPDLTDLFAPSKFYPDGVPATVDEVLLLADSVLGCSTVRSGTYLLVGELMVAKYLREPVAVNEAPIGTMGVTRHPRWPTSIFTDTDTPQRREAILRFYLDCLNALSPWPPFAARAGALARLYTKILNDPELLARHRTESKEALVRWWQNDLPLDDADRAVLPDYASAAGYLTWALTGLRAVHDRMVATVGDDAGDFTELIAGTLLRIEKTVAPSVLANAGIGIDGVDAINRAVRAWQPNYDRNVWVDRIGE